MKKRKDGRYCLKKVINGETVYIYGKTEREVYKKLEDLENQGSKKQKTYGEYSEEWGTLKKDQIGHRTWNSYENVLKMLRDVCKKDITEVSCFDIQSVINKAYYDGYSKTVLLRIRSVNSMIIDYAIGQGERIINFTPAIKIQKNAKREERHGLSETEIKKVEDNWNTKYGLYAYFLLYTGLRRGEALALQWKDIDFGKREISITKAVEYKANQAEIKLPKTKNSIRTVPLIENLAEKLIPGEAEEYVFGKEKPYSNTMACKRWSTYLKETGLEITQHQLRHTFATMLCKVNVSAKDAQKLLGHADYKTTMNIYTDFQKSAVKNAQNALNSYMSSQKSSQNPENP